MSVCHAASRRGNSLRLELAFCHRSPDSVRAFLDRIFGLGKKGHDGIESTGTSVSVEVHAKSGSRGIDLVRRCLVDYLALIPGS